MLLHYRRGYQEAGRTLTQLASAGPFVLDAAETTGTPKQSSRIFGIWSEKWDISGRMNPKAAIGIGAAWGPWKMLALSMEFVNRPDTAETISA